MTMRAFAVALVLLAVAGGAANSRPLTAVDLSKMSRVSDPHVSPDGRVSFTV